jgi:hypothetical protein
MVVRSFAPASPPLRMTSRKGSDVIDIFKKSGEEAELLAELHGLRPPPGA